MKLVNTLMIKSVLAVLTIQCIIGYTVNRNSVVNDNIITNEKLIVYKL